MESPWRSEPSGVGSRHAGALYVRGASPFSAHASISMSTMQKLTLRPAAAGAPNVPTRWRRARTAVAPFRPLPSTANSRESAKPV